MKARVKATGDILEIASYATIPMEYCDSYGDPLSFSFDEVEILSEKIERNEPDYWERLEHQYAGMAMQGMLSGWWSENIADIVNSDREHFNILVHKANELAHALVEKYKKEE